MKKRILALFLASIMLCSAAACSNGTESLDDETTISTTASTVTDDQVMEILKSAFRRNEVTALIHSFLRENMTAENEEDGMQSS